MADRSIPCAKVMNSKDMAEHPHYRARQAHIEWEDEEAGRVHGTGIVPKLSATPGKIWRGSPALGQDNRLVYGELLGLSAGEIENLKRDGNHLMAHAPHVATRWRPAVIACSLCRPRERRLPAPGRIALRASSRGINHLG